MKLKTKLLLGVGSTLIAATPIAILASCSKVDAPTKAPNALKNSGYLAKEGTSQTNAASTGAQSATVTSQNTNIKVASHNNKNNFFNVTLPTTYSTAFSTTDTNFNDSARVTWSVKAGQTNSANFNLTNNVLKTTVGLAAGNTALILVATITESGKQTQTLDVTFTFNVAA